MFRLGGVLSRLVSATNKSSAAKNSAGSVFSQRLVAKKPAKNVLYTPISRLNSSISFKYPTTEVYHPPKHLSDTAHIAGFDQYKKLYQESIENPEKFWDKTAKSLISWFRPYDKVVEGGLHEGDVAWFLNGTLNACYNCVDRHVEKKGDQTAILYEGDEPGMERKVTYKQLYKEVNKLANGLKELGVKKGDRVAIYLPMSMGANANLNQIPEAVVAMMACARIGAVHLVVFAGFSADALRDRINNAKAKVLLTANEGMRGGRAIFLKRTADEAVAFCPTIEHVVVFKRTDEHVPFGPRDVWWHELTQKQKPYCPPEPMNSEDPLFLLYTSGSTGKPKGLEHTTGGYTVYASATHRYIFDYKDGDVYACVADVGWITGHTYIVYGPLLNGATTTIFESVPTYPDASRYWQMVEKHKITQFYTAPTAIRTLMKFGTDPVKKYDRSSLRVLGSVGEPINPEAWKWYHEVVGERRCAIVDTYWQTETGGIVLSPLPGATPTKPGSATLPFFGVEPVVIDATSGHVIHERKASGVLALKNPWPGMARTVFGDHSRYIETYLGAYKGYYFTGDGVNRDEDGYYWITGRVDDVIHKSGHRLGTAEIESALASHQSCAEAAVVAVHEEVRGSLIIAFCILRHGYNESKEVIDDLKHEVQKEIGKLATPDVIVITPGLPKTRSGKIMRRLLRKVAEGTTKVEELGDISTLADPEIVDFLIKKVKSLNINKKPLQAKL